MGKKAVLTEEEMAAKAAAKAERIAAAKAKGLAAQAAKAASGETAAKKAAKAVNGGQEDGKKKKGKKEGKGKGNAGGDTSMGLAEAGFVQHRLAVWDRIQKVHDAKREELIKEGKKITVTLPDGKTVEGIAGVLTPLVVAEGIHKMLAQKAVVAKVDGKVWDMHRALVADCNIEICNFQTKEGAETFWHSSAHILGQALEEKYGAHLCIGPPLEEGGFYYDVYMKDRSVLKSEYPALETSINNFVKAKHPFQRLEITRAEAIEMFSYNPFKIEVLERKVGENDVCSIYRCGPLIDLCRGPHVPHTGKITAMTVTMNSSAYWLANADNAALQRVYGMSFPDKKQMKEHQRLLEEAAKRDHRKLGTEQNLFFFHQLSPGSAFFLPHGTRIYNQLVEFMKKQYIVRGFEEVMSPNIFNVDLWKTSGHYQNYAENMFSFHVEGQEFAMKPMNCPGHCLVFAHTLRSYKELPLRWADFGVLHRNELSGALGGLTRVRRFQQDDAHIFCRQDQIEQEVSGCLDFLDHVYGVFGFQFSMELSTRPAKYLGEIAKWDQAESALANCLNKFGQPWKVNAADGAFYGPKIDIQLTDALKRKHQCATIQLDYQLPERFDLTYKAEGAAQFERPVIIHRAILGSVERMFGILVEHTGGKWPLWLSPRQAIVVPIQVSDEIAPHCTKVRQTLVDLGFYCDFNDTRDQFKKKIRDAQIAQYNMILVVGKEEASSNSVNVRNRDNPDEQNIMKLDEFVAMVQKMRDDYD